MTDYPVVKQGQRYAQRFGGQPQTTVWRVCAVDARPVSIPHARLINEEDPLETKTISCTTLADRIYFELVADASANAR